MTRPTSTRTLTRRLVILLALTLSCAALAEGGGSVGGGGWGKVASNVSSTPSTPA